MAWSGECGSGGVPGADLRGRCVGPFSGPDLSRDHLNPEGGALGSLVPRVGQPRRLGVGFPLHKEVSEGKAPSRVFGSSWLVIFHMFTKHSG